MHNFQILMNAILLPVKMGLHVLIKSMHINVRVCLDGLGIIAKQVTKFLERISHRRRDFLRSLLAQKMYLQNAI